MTATMNLITCDNPDRPALDMALTAALLDSVGPRCSADTIRVFRPGPTVAFGRIDRLRAGYGAACRLAAARGRTPVVRLGGGHAVAYDRNCILIEVIRRHKHAIKNLQGRFIELATLLQTALAQLEIDVTVGELPAEYCPGRFSLHLPGGPKVAGIAQRIVRGASLTTTALVVDGGDVLRTIIAEIYSELDLPLDPTTVGALSDRYKEVRIEQIMSAIVNLVMARYRGAHCQITSNVSPTPASSPRRRAASAGLSGTSGSTHVKLVDH